MVPGTVPGSRRNRRETPGYPESDWKGLFSETPGHSGGGGEEVPGSREGCGGGVGWEVPGSQFLKEPTILKDFVEIWCDRFCAAGEPEFR